MILLFTPTRLDQTYDGFYFTPAFTLILDVVVFRGYEVDVDEQWAKIIADLDRQDYNNQHKETRRHYSLDACIYEGNDFAVEDDEIVALLTEPSLTEQLHIAISKLNDNQKRLIEAIYYYNIPVSEYAKREGVDQSAISHRLQTIKKNLKKLL